MANELTPWAAIRAMRAARVIALNKFPGICPAGMADAWSRLLCKFMLAVTIGDATVACGSNQVCASLKAGIEGCTLAPCQIYDQHAMKEDFGFLLIDAKNAFNEMDRHCVLWTI